MSAHLLPSCSPPRRAAADTYDVNFNGAATQEQLDFFRRNGFLHLGTAPTALSHTQRAVITGHRTRAAMVMYYPGAADVDMGPTAIVPSSHILARDGLGLSLGVTEEGPAAEFDRDDWSGLGAGGPPTSSCTRSTGTGEGGWLVKSSSPGWEPRG